MEELYKCWNDLEQKIGKLILYMIQHYVPLAINRNDEKILDEYKQ